MDDADLALPELASSRKRDFKMKKVQSFNAEDPPLSIQNLVKQRVKKLAGKRRRSKSIYFAAPTEEEEEEEKEENEKEEASPSTDSPCPVHNYASKTPPLNTQKGDDYFGFKNANKGGFKWTMSQNAENQEKESSEKSNDTSSASSNSNP